MTPDPILNWPVMDSSHGEKPAVAPLPITDPQELRKMVLESLEYIRTFPWPGDRIKEHTMRQILTMARYILDATDATEEMDDSEPLDLLRKFAELQVEDFDDPDELIQLWLSADDIAGRLRERLKQLNYWYST